MYGFFSATLRGTQKEQHCMWASTKQKPKNRIEVLEQSTEPNLLLARH